MIKKVLIIASIIIIIVSQIGVCYAEDFNDYVVNSNSSNPNVKQITAWQFFDDSLIARLYEYGYMSVFSRYATTTVHCRISDIYISVELVYSGDSYSNFTSYVNSNNFLNITFNDNISNVVNNLSIYKSTYNYTSNYSLYFRLSGSVEFDLLMNNDALAMDDGSTTHADYLNWGKINLNLPSTSFTNNGHNYNLIAIYDHGVDKYNYTITYSFDRLLSNVLGFAVATNSYIEILANYAYQMTQPNYAFDYSLNGQTYSRTYHNTLNGHLNLDNICFDVKMIDKSTINVLSYSCRKTNNQNGCNVPTNSEVGQVNYCFTTIAPLIYTKSSSTYIQGSANNTDTPLHIDYYDCEWYEIHYQLANAFIFLITELPIVSDVTNLIYTLADIINNSLGILTNFNGFGIIFAFGMFAIILGIFLKFIIGSD